MTDQKKVAIITGASRGIGACVARGLAADGYVVALAARSRESLAALCNQINSGAERIEQAIAYPLDVQDGDAVDSMVADLVSKYGRIDLLFNNAGIDVPGTLDVSIRDLERLLAVNLVGPFSLLRAVVPIMREQRSGAIINLASRAGRVGLVDNGAYSASKFGLVGLSESLYRELSPLGIKITSLCPSWVDTEMACNANLAKEEMIQQEDILATVRWILSLSPAAVVKDLVIECRQRII
jgi:NAD(P)-dependent dehydrogenase (short-subunit alcohol dehydrogenase family)